MKEFYNLVDKTNFPPGPPAPPPQITWIRFEDKKPTKNGAYLVWDENNTVNHYMFDNTYNLPEIENMFYRFYPDMPRIATHYALFKEFEEENE